MKIISTEHLAQLLRASAKLAVLENAGVYDWIWYEKALKDADLEDPPYSDYINLSDELITDGFKDFNVRKS